MRMRPLEITWLQRWPSATTKHLLIYFLPPSRSKSNIQKNNNQSRTKHKTGGVEEAALLPFGREQNGRYRTGRWSASYCLNYTHWMTKKPSRVCVTVHQLVVDVEVVPSTINTHTRGKQESRKQNKSNTTHIHAIWYNPDGRGAWTNDINFYTESVVCHQNPPRRLFLLYFIRPMTIGWLKKYPNGYLIFLFWWSGRDR